MRPEVSCKVFGVVLDGLAARGIAPELLVDGLSTNVDVLRDANGRISWDLFTSLMARLEVICGGPEALQEIGYQNFDTATYSVLRRVASFFAEPRDVYWLGTVWFGRDLFTVIEDHFEDLPGGRVREVLRIPKTHKPCPQLFYVIHGALRAAPKMLGLGAAQVEAAIGPHEASFLIAPPVARRSLRRLLRAVRHSLNARPVIEQLSRQQQELKRANAEASQAIDALRESEDRHRVFSELGSDICYAVRMGPGGFDVDWISGAFEAITGYEVDDIGDEWRHLIHPDDVRSLIDQWADARSGIIRRVEYRIVTKQGESRWVSGALRSERVDAQTVRILGAIQDITARKHAEQAHQRLVTAVDQAGEGIAVLDVRARIVYANPAFLELVDRSAEQVVGAPIDSLSFGPTDNALLAEMRQLLGAGREFKGRYVTRWDDGSEFVRDATVAPVRDQNNRVEGYVGVIHDVTREVEVEEELLRAQRMDALGRLAGGLAHDFNNVLTVIEGYCDMLLDRDQVAGSLREALEMIQDASGRGSQLIRRLLAFSREQQMEARALDANQLVRDVVAILRRVIGANIELEAELATDLPDVYADPSCMEHVLLNLAINARDAMPDGGMLRFQTEPVNLSPDRALAIGLEPGEYVTILVSDTGSGMNEEVRSRIFEPFFTTKDVGKGTGLGLSSAFGVMRQTGGHLVVRSEPGKGSLFTVFLPLMGAGHASGPSVAESSRTGRRVLLVERDAVVRALARATLAEGGYYVVEARSSHEAVDVAATSGDSLDLLLMGLDSGKPEEVHLYSQLQQQHPGIAVLYMSGYPEVATEAPPPGISPLQLLTKPFTPSELVARVRVALDSARVAGAASVQGASTDPE